MVFSGSPLLEVPRVEAEVVPHPDHADGPHVHRVRVQAAHESIYLDRQV